MTQQLHPWAFIWEKWKLTVHAKTCTWMFPAGLFLIAPKLNSPDILQQMMVPLYHGIPLSNKEEWTINTCNTWVNLQRIMLHGGIKANSKRLYTVCLHLYSYNIFEITKFLEIGELIGRFQGVFWVGRREVGVVIKGQRERSCSDGNILYLDCGHGCVKLYMW